MKNKKLFPIVMPKDFLDDLKETEKRKKKADKIIKAKEEKDRIRHEKASKKLDDKLKNKDLVGLVNSIVDWCVKFSKSSDGNKCLEICGEIWLAQMDGAYTLDPHAWHNFSAHLLLSCDPTLSDRRKLILLVTRRLNGQQDTLLRVDLFWDDKKLLIRRIVKKVERRILETISEALTTGKVFDFIRSTLQYKKFSTKTK